MAKKTIKPKKAAAVEKASVKNAPAKKTAKKSQLRISPDQKKILRF
jgi:hypothetical protein